MMTTDDMVTIVIVLLSFHCALFHLDECTISSVVAIKFLIAHARLG